MKYFVNPILIMHRYYRIIGTICLRFLQKKSLMQGLNFLFCLSCSLRIFGLVTCQLYFLGFGKWPCSFFLLFPSFPETFTNCDLFMF